MPRLTALLAAALVAAGCATAPSVPATPALFVVVPGSDGHVGKVVVHRDGAAHAIDTAYGARRLGVEGDVSPVRLTPEEVRARFGPTLDALPGKPTRFVLYFMGARDELTASSKVELEKVLAELRRRPLPDIVVTGHTDTVGSLAYNDRLSRARAERLREILVEIGLPAERIQVAGRGKRELLVPTEDAVAEPRNRRVEIDVR